jgi:hypothetical protein
MPLTVRFDLCRFWEFSGNDFCYDLNQWTTNLTSTISPPLVHSLSYGWQGNLSRVHCDENNLQVIDNNFAKLAARGISVVVSSGDSGSGYSDLNPQCDMAEGGGLRGVSFDGAVVRTVDAFGGGGCCREAGSAAAGWTYTPPNITNTTAVLAGSYRDSLQALLLSSLEARTSQLVNKGAAEALVVAPTPRPPAPASVMTAPAPRPAVIAPAPAPAPPAIAHAPAPAPFKHLFDHVQYTTANNFTTDPIFKSHDVQTLNGEISLDGGKVSVDNANGTFAGTTITFSSVFSQPPTLLVSNVTATFEGKAGFMTYHGRALFLAPVGQSSNCLVIEWKCPNGHGAFWSPPPPPAPAPAGTCTIYSSISSNSSAPSTTISSLVTKPPVVLWPSWPASSPWVTAVGATRFVGQQVGNEEMASDQFGSGGGFSNQFAQSPHAKWQEAAVAAYLSTVDPASLPPAASFPREGRATPDVSALGEVFTLTFFAFISYNIHLIFFAFIGL